MEDDALRELLLGIASLVAELKMNYGKLTEFVDEQREFNRQQVAMNGRLETLVTGMLRQDENGR